MVGTLGPGVGYGKASRFMYIATAGQVTFNGADSSAQALTLGYTPNYVEVIVNGVWLPPQDYTATNGSSIVLGSGCVAGDIVYVYALSAFQLNLTPFPSPGALWGLTMSTAGSSTTLSVAKGSAADSTNTTMIQLAATTAKTTSAWAAGTAAGGLDTGAIAASTWYHWFLIFNPTTLAVDVVFSATATPANGPTTLPTGYTLFRRIGSMLTNGSSQWVLFHQRGDEFLWDADDAGNAAYINSVSIPNAATLKTATVPTGIQVIAHIRSQLAASASNPILLISPPDQIDQLASAVVTMQSASGVSSCGEQFVRTNTSGQIRFRASVATNLYSTTAGWIDDRGKLS